jgi:Na+/melibiose symporter-like transporter
MVSHPGPDASPNPAADRGEHYLCPVTSALDDPSGTAPAVELPRGVRAGYGLGSVATGTFGTVPGLMLLPYLTDTLGIAAVLAGLIVFLPKAWDVVLNPIAGRISDRSTDPRGPRRPFLLKAGLLLALFFALLFAAPDLDSQIFDAAWVLVMFVACATAYAFFQVPYVAMPAEITDSYDERTRLMTWRVAILAFAIMLSGATAPAIRDALGGRAGYRVMGVSVAVLLVVGVVGAYVGTRSAPVGRVASSPGTLREQLRIVGRARDFRLLLATFVVQALATGAMLAGVAYVSRWVLVDKGAATILFVCFVGPALLLTPAWSSLGQRIGKKKGYVASTLVLALAALLLLWSRSAPDWWVYAATALVGVGYAGAQVFPMAMLPDAAAVDARRTGENRTGVYTGVWTAGETLGLALGPAVYAVVLAAGGYLSSDLNADWTDQYQPSSALTAIVLGFSLIPAVLILLSLVPLSRYALDSSVVEERAQ